MLRGHIPDAGIWLVFSLSAPGVRMDEPGTNPLIVILLFLARCLVPLLLLLGVSALLRRWGLIRDQEPPAPPAGEGQNRGQATHEKPA